MGLPKGVGWAAAGNLTRIPGQGIRDRRARQAGCQCWDLDILRLAVGSDWSLAWSGVSSLSSEAKAEEEEDEGMIRTSWEQTVEFSQLEKSRDLDSHCSQGIFLSNSHYLDGLGLLICKINILDQLTVRSFSLFGLHTTKNGLLSLHFL